MLGVIGIALPLVPTTPFILLAGVCFAESSPRFHRWLLANKTFGPMIKNWQQGRFVSRHTKIRALLMMAVTFPLSIWVIDILWARVVLFLCWLICSIFILLLPSVSRSKHDINTE